ncbi:MAG TPA: SEL1-like repeat protein [Kiloniellales bacterium]
MSRRAPVLGFLLLLSTLLAACSDEFLERVQATSDNLDSWFARKGVVAQEPTAAAPRSAEPAGADRVYQEGLALKRDGAPAKAAERFQVAAEAGHSAAAYELAEAYWQGDGVARDDEAATKWLTTAADRGEPRAQYLLGAAYYGGLGVEQDDALALHWLGEAATRGHDRAQFLLAEAFANGRGVETDLAWAARWYGKAARQGHSGAQLAYGLLLAKGRGLPADDVQGYTWLTIAARNGQAEAEAARGGVAQRLRPAERAAAEAEAERFRPRANIRFADPPTVMYVQYRLSRLGFPVGGVDGLMGPRTRDGIHAYQRARGRPTDGRLTPDLLIALLQEPKV